MRLGKHFPFIAGSFATKGFFKGINVNKYMRWDVIKFN